VRGLFVSGTDTGVGKTVVAGAIAAALTRAGERVAAFKPVVTGLDEPAAPGWPHDHELLAAAAGTTPEAVAPRRYGPPVSPHLAAELAGEGAALGGTGGNGAGRPLAPAPTLEELVGAARAAAAGADVLVVEGVGGLLVPLTAERSVRDLACELDLPVIVAARPGLGTINHTLLTLEAARATRLKVVAVVITPWPDAPTRMEISNRDTIERLGALPVAMLPRIEAGTPDHLAAAGARLPIADWLR
jgi:dethiobiotin synthetase